MLDQEYSSPGPEYSRPGTELAPTGRAFDSGEGEYFPEAPELAQAPEDTRVSPPMPSGRKRRGAGRGVLRQAAAAVAIGAVTVTAVAAVSGVSPNGLWDSRAPEYIYSDFTEAQRDYLDRALAAMEDGDDMAVQSLLQDEGGTFDEIFQDIVEPLAQDLADRNGGTALPGTYVGYDGTGLISLWGDGRTPNAYITLTGYNLSGLTRYMTFGGSGVSINADYTEDTDPAATRFLWRLDNLNDPASSGNELLRRVYQGTYAREARLTGTFEDLYTVDGKYCIRTLRSGTAQYRAGTFLNADAAVGTAQVEEFVTVSCENMEFRPKERDGSLYVDVVLEGSGRINYTYIVTDLIAPQGPTDYAYYMLNSGTPVNQFGNCYELNNAPDDSGGTQEPADAGYVYTGFTDEQRDFLSGVFTAMDGLNDMAAEDLLWYYRDTFTDILENIVLPCANDIARRLDLPDTEGGDLASLVGYDSKGFVSLREHPDTAAYLILKPSDGAVTQLTLTFENDEGFTTTYLFMNGAATTFYWQHNITRDGYTYADNITDAALIQRTYDPGADRNQEAALFGDFIIVPGDGRPSVLALADGTARFSAGRYTAPADRTYAASATASVENSRTVLDGSMSFLLRPYYNNSGDSYINVMLTDTRGNQYEIDTFVAPLRPDDASAMMSSNEYLNQFGVPIY